MGAAVVREYIGMDKRVHHSVMGHSVVCYIHILAGVDIVPWNLFLGARNVGVSVQILMHTVICEQEPFVPSLAG